MGNFADGHWSRFIRVHSGIGRRQANAQSGPRSSFNQSTQANVYLHEALLTFVDSGIGQVVQCQGLDYAEHVTEYGVHWNFFFTLALLPPFVALFDSILVMKPYALGMSSLLVAGLYQASLELTSLKAYILTAPRYDLLSKNREGVFSFIGYLAIFLAGKALGLQILPRGASSDSKSVDTLAQRKRLLVQLIAWSGLWCAAFLASTSYRYGLGWQVSRRLANLPYALWVSAFNCAQLTLFCMVETLLFPTVYKAVDGASERREVEGAMSWVLKAFNRNGLAVFLAANLLTGLVNLTLDTLSMGQTESMFVLLTYAGLITSLALVMDSFNVSIKL